MKTKLLALLIFNFSPLANGLIFNCEAATRYVSTTGTATPPYTTWATASDSIQKCINICNDGDTVVVANGIYKETLAITKRIALLGSSMDSCIIDGRGLNGIYTDFITIEVLADCTIRNFFILGKSIDGCVLIRARDVILKLKNCKLENASYVIQLANRSSEINGIISKNYLITFIKSFVPSVIDSVYPRIENNLINHNLGEESVIWCNWGGHNIIKNNLINISLSEYSNIAIDASGWVRSIDIENNIIIGSTTRDIFVSDHSDSVIIMNNVLRDKNVGGRGIWVYDGRKTKIRNNIIADNEYGLVISDYTADTDYNLFWNNVSNTWSNAQMGQHSIIADPMFVNDSIPLTEIYDFHLQMYSPAIDAGDPAILDVDGTRSDIGAYGGPGGEKYDYLDIAPRKPSGLTANILFDSLLTVRWKINTEKDFSHYKIFRDTVHSFVPDSSNLIAVQKANAFSQVVPDNIRVLYYRISAVDSQGNESKLSEELGVIITSIEDNTISLVQDYHLYQNYPNPFNSTTVIPFILENAGYVKIALFDITGELVGYVLNEYKSAGYNEVKFDTEKFGKSKLTSGIYLYRIEVITAGGIPSFTDIKKMLLIK